MAAVFGGNIIRTVVGGTFYMASILYITSWVAPLVTDAAIASNFDMAGNSSITAMAEGGLWTTLMYVLASDHLGWIGIGIIGIITVFGLFYVNKVRPNRSQVKEEAS